MSCIFGKSQEGKSIDAFVNNKNILNCDERGEAGEISKKVFLKAFEIYIHATHYNTEEAFGCNQCPGELEKGEQEDDFENKHEVGIDIGNMQRREWWRKTFSRFQRCHQVCIICICSLRHLTILCQHF